MGCCDIKTSKLLNYLILYLEEEITRKVKIEKDLSEITIIIKNKNYNDILFKGSLDSCAIDLIDYYKSNLEVNKNNCIIIFKKEDGQEIFLDKTLAENGLKDNDTIAAEIIEENELLKEEIKKQIKEKVKEGLIPIIIQNSTLYLDLYYVSPKLKFKVIAEKFHEKHQEKKWYFLYSGKIIDEEKTFEELKIKALSRILVNELEIEEN